MELTCGASHLLQVHSLPRLHGLGGDDGWIQGLAIKLQHGVLQNDAKLNKKCLLDKYVTPSDSTFFLPGASNKK